MHTGIVQPSGPSIHCCTIFGSVCARYTDLGGAEKRLVTTTWVSPSVLSLSLLIVFHLVLDFSWWLELRPAGCSPSPEPLPAWRAIVPSRQSPSWKCAGDVSLPRCEQPPVPH